MTGSATETRPGLLLPAILTTIGVIVLAALGAWQLSRMEQKQSFIARLEQQAAGTPAAMPAADSWKALDPTAIDLTRVAVSGRWIGEQFVTVRTTLAAGERGSRQLSGFGRWVFQGFRTEDGGTILVNRGFVPESRLSQIAPAQGEARLNGFLRAPEDRNSFTPDDIPARLEFYTRDPAGIAQALGLQPASFYVEAERVGDALAVPAGVDARELIGRIPDNHLQYAMTWFGLALTLLGVFIAYAVSRRRVSNSAPLP